MRARRDPHRRRGCRTASRPGTAGSGRRRGRRSTRAACSVANAASRSAPVAAREAPPRQAQVPRRQVVDEGLDEPRRAERVEVGQAVRRRRGQGRAPRQDPAIHRRALEAGRRRRSPGVQPGEAGVGHEERVDVPQDEEPPARLVGRVPAEQDVVVGPGRHVQPAHDVDAHPLGRLVELDGVAPALVHRPAVLAEERGVAEDRLERRLPAEDRRHRQHRVEPVPELAREALGDEVGREPLGPEVGVLAEVEGRERHDAGVEPRVADVGDPRRPPAADGGSAISTSSMYGRCGVWPSNAPSPRPPAPRSSLAAADDVERRRSRRSRRSAAPAPSSASC